MKKNKMPHATLKYHAPKHGFELLPVKSPCLATNTRLEANMSVPVWILASRLSSMKMPGPSVFKKELIQDACSCSVQERAQKLIGSECTHGWGALLLRPCHAHTVSPAWSDDQHKVPQGGLVSGFINHGPAICSLQFCHQLLQHQCLQRHAPVLTGSLRRTVQEGHVFDGQETCQTDACAHFGWQKAVWTGSIPTSCRAPEVACLAEY